MGSRSVRTCSPGRCCALEYIPPTTELCRLSPVYSLFATCPQLASTSRTHPVRTQIAGDPGVKMSVSRTRYETASMTRLVSSGSVPERVSHSPCLADCLSHGAQKRMRYAVPWYASDIVIKGGQKLVGWPANVPFTDPSSITGGVKILGEIFRRLHLPDGDPNKLRFEPASREDKANAARNPESVHPTPQHLPELKAREAARAARAITVEVDIYHPVDMRRVGCESTSTAPDPREHRQQRWDTGKRRAQASDTELRVWKRRPREGIKSMGYVLPGVDKASGGGEQGLKEYPLDDRIIDFELTTAFR